MNGMCCGINEVCLFCEYSSIVDMVLKMEKDDDIILMGLYCEYMGKYAIPKYNHLKGNAFDSNILEDGDVEKVLEYYSKIEGVCGV